MAKNNSKDFIDLMETNPQVRKVYLKLKSTLEEKEAYDQVLDIQLYNCSTQIVLYNKLVNDIIMNGGESREQTVLINLSNSLRNNLKGIGLISEKTIVQKKEDVKEEEEQPLLTMLEEIKEIRG